MTPQISKTVRFASLLLPALLAASVPAEAQVSLGTVVALAQRDSSSVRLAEADVRKAEATLSESKDVIIPSLTFSTGLPTFPEVGFTGAPPSLWTATVQSLVFSVPQKRYIDAAHFGLRAAASRLKDARERVALDASVAYIELNTVHQELEAASQQELYARQLVSIEQQRSEAGVDPLSELLQAKLTEAQIKLIRIRLESRAGTLEAELAALTGLPAGSIATDPGSIPEIPKLKGDVPALESEGIRSAQFIASSKMLVAKGDKEFNYLPQLAFIAQYNRNTTLLNDVNSFFAKPLPANNFSSGISVQIPIFDMWHRAKARESAADALRARVEVEDARRKNDVQIAELNGSLRELDAQAEVASLKQQIAAEQLKTVATQLELGNGAGAGPGAPPQLSPKAEQLARIDASQKLQDSLDAGFSLAKARLSLLEALGHMQDWLNELHAK
ncbi:MAG TPA: TolC family protein [Terracidiphilus sp.]|nr:TolC family protein [Terracidiphilus sp.]